MLPINNVKSNSPLSTMHILKITSSQWLVGSRSFPKVLQELVGIMKTHRCSVQHVQYNFGYISIKHIKETFLHESKCNLFSQLIKTNN